MTLPRALRLPPEWTPYVLLSPFVVLFCVFGLFPLAFSLSLAFQSWEPTSGLTAMSYVGLDNFVFSLQDRWFWTDFGLVNAGLRAVFGGEPIDWLERPENIKPAIATIPLVILFVLSSRRLIAGLTVGAVK
jgi:ABC-type sugar transport system permease subunit